MFNGFRKLDIRIILVKCLICVVLGKVIGLDRWLSVLVICFVVCWLENGWVMFGSLMCLLVLVSMFVIVSNKMVVWLCLLILDSLDWNIMDGDRLV